MIAGGPFRQRDNVVRVPDGPGLGVELDREALARWHAHYLENGPMDHFLDPWGTATTGASRSARSRTSELGWHVSACPWAPDAILAG